MARLAAEYVGAYAVTRLLAAVGGLLLVRLLPVSEYGFYTLVLSAFVFICSFSDLGVTETLSFFRRRASIKRKPWMPYLLAVIRFRRTFFFLGFTASLFYVYFTGAHLQEATIKIIFGIVVMGLSAWFAIQVSITVYVLKLEQQFRYAYAIELCSESTKFFAVCLIWILGVATALAGLISVLVGSVAAAILASWLHRKLIGGTTPFRLDISQRTRRVLLGQVIPVLPGTIYFTVQGLSGAWLAAYYGSIVNLAEVGALGRLGALITVMAGFTSTVFVPRLIAIQDETIFFKRYLQWWMVMFGFGGVVILFVWLFPDPLLYILGAAYSDLRSELLISAAIAVVVTWSTFSWNINRTRGWVKYQPYRAPVMFVGQAIMFITFDFSTTQNVLLFGLGSYLIDFMFQTLISASGFLFRRSIRL